MFVGKARMGAPEGSGKLGLGWGGLSGANTVSSLQQTQVNYGCKKFYKIVP